MDRDMTRYPSLDRFERDVSRHGQPQPIGEILAELLAQYQARFPDARITVVETPASAA